MQNRIYKDSLFKLIFGREDNGGRARLLSLYNALNGSRYDDPSALELTTIENVIYVTMKNDVSFLIGSETCLIEQQSTFNPNMPLRGLLYFAQLYHKHLNAIGRDLYGRTLVKIPAPKFYVLYNGAAEIPDEQELRLSDAFEKPAPGFEWTALMLNVNIGHNQRLLEACGHLKDYSTYIKIVREKKAAGLRGDDAVNAAVAEAIRLNLLGGLFKIQKSEVLDMSLTEFDKEEYDRNRREEGAQEKAVETARKMLSDGLPEETIIRYTGLSQGKLQELLTSEAV